VTNGVECPGHAVNVKNATFTISSHGVPSLAKVFAEGDPRDSEYSPREKFPSANMEQILELARNRPDALEELTGSSLIKEQISVEEWLQVLYRPKDQLCVMESSWDVAIKPLSEWLGNVARARYAVPNPFRDALYGRTVSNVLFRRYVVVESDLAPTLVKMMRLNEFDLQAAVILHLRELDLLRLRSVVYSGRKSLHSWWSAQDDEANRSFFAKAVALGADRSLFTLNHAARICNPSERQLLLYLA
jgi:hypothetical protein